MAHVNLFYLLGVLIIFSSCTFPQTKEYSLEDEAKWRLLTISYTDSALNTSNEQNPYIDPLKANIYISKTVQVGDTTDFFIYFYTKDTSYKHTYISMPLQCFKLRFVKEQFNTAKCYLQLDDQKFYSESEDAFIRFLKANPDKVPEWAMEYYKAKKKKD